MAERESLLDDRHPKTCRCGGTGYVERGPTGATYSYPCYPWDSPSPFDRAIEAIRSGADYSLRGLTLTVNGIALAITDEQFDIVYDVMDEVDGNDSVIGIAG